MSIKPIETYYRGIKTRSRLEARWAVWLDVLGISWRYEQQGYSLPSGSYLPDFFLPFANSAPYPQGTPPHQGYWLEIKPCALTEQEERLLGELAVQTGHHAYAFAGDPWPGEFRLYRAACQGGQLLRRQGNECTLCDGQKMSRLCEARFEYPPGPCELCEGTGTGSEVLFLGQNLHGLISNCSRHYHDTPEWYPNTSMMKAFYAARSARFEYGETPTF